MTDRHKKVFLEFRSASKAFDGLRVFEDLSLSLKAGVAYGLVGPNACGKTTLLHSAMGLIKLDGGLICYKGMDITGLKPHSVVRLGLGILLQNVGIFQRISVLDNILTGLAARTSWLTENERDDQFQELALSVLSKVGLEEYATRPAGTLVPGEQKRLAIARTLFAAKDFLFDEPVAGIDNRTRDSLSKLIRQLVDEGRSILLVEHDLDFVLQTCDEILMLKDGRIVCQGPPELIRDEQEFDKFYSSLRIERPLSESKQ